MILASSLVDILGGHIASAPQAPAYIFLDDAGKASTTYTYEQIDLEARAVAAVLNSSCPRGATALLLYPAGPEFIIAFWACLYAGVIAVPVQLPGPNKPLDKICGIIKSAGISLILTDTKSWSSLRKKITGNVLLENISCVFTDQINKTERTAWKAGKTDPDALAFLQYTSGSTGSPKGTRVLHRNIFDNVRMIRDAFRLTPSSVGVGWLPFHHDMGLIGNVLTPLFTGMQCVLMSPMSFLQNPYRWLKAISDYRACASGGPNFGYELCCNKITDVEIATLDLSCWEVAFNGAEPVKANTIRRFASRFAAAGFKQQSFFPCYGMAENTLIITGGHFDEADICVADAKILETENSIVTCQPADSRAREIVSCGPVLDNQQLLIVDPVSGNRLEEGRTGEIWIAGRSMADGYWNLPEISQAVFGAILRETAEGPFLRSGDIGFLRDRHLFVTGRQKDMFIVRGRNYYPQDIEHTVEREDEIVPSGVAVFAVAGDDEEQIVVVAEVERVAIRSLNADELIGRIRGQVAMHHELELFAVVLVKPLSIPRTSSGKIQRFMCRQQFAENTFSVIDAWCASEGVTSGAADTVAGRQEEQPVLSVKFLTEWLKEKVTQHLKTARESIDIFKPIDTYGLNSLTAVTIANELEALLHRPVPPTIVYDYPSIHALAVYLAGGQTASAAGSGELAGPSDEPVAIIGMECRFPGANNTGEFWQLLAAGKDAVREVDEQHWSKAALEKTLKDKRLATVVSQGGFINDVDLFDAAFFGISPREASYLDPQQRIFLEVSWNALENAGIAPLSLGGQRVGVYVGVSNNDYALLRHQHSTLPEVYAGTGNALSIVANRLSYVLDLRGPSLAIDTACSSSLVAVHQAAQSLRNGECNLAVAGGVNIILNPMISAVFAGAGMLSDDGRCKTLDAAANGYVRGEGSGVVILRRLSDALANGDNILAVIRGSAVNQDGRSNGITAPNGLSQQQVIREALRKAGLSTGDIGYFELHGTGTALGDTIEMNSLAELLKETSSASHPHHVGSVKTNIGHLESAAGIAGLIKVLLMIRHRQLPPLVNFHNLNPKIAFDPQKINIPLSLENWDIRHGEPLRAGISSFGFGGTNSHLIVEQPPVVQTAENNPVYGQGILALSAPDETALQALIHRYVVYLDTPEHASLEDIAFTAGTGRSHFACRLAAQAGDIAILKEQLQQIIAGKLPVKGVKTGNRPKKDLPGIAFLFTGQGSQYKDMGKELYQTQSVFREAIDRCNDLLSSSMDVPLLDVLYGADTTASAIHQTKYAQPAIFSIGYALARLWRSWGVCPDVLTGHSIGEYVVAHEAGIISLEDALLMVAARGRLMQELPGGGKMYAVMLPAAKVQQQLASHENEVSVAAVNGPEHTVISGDGAVTDMLVAQWKAAGITVMPLEVSHAFHSPLMRPVKDVFRKICMGVTFKPGNIPVVANAGGAVSGEAMASADYWVEHIEQPVMFCRGIETLKEKNCSIFVEMGAKPILTNMGRQILNKEGLWLPSVKTGQSALTTLTDGIAALYTSGVDIDWKAFYRERPGRKVPLPVYPFQRKRYWSTDDTTDLVPAHLNGRDEPHTDKWGYQPVWVQQARSTDIAPGSPRMAWLLFDAEEDSLLVKEITARGESYFLVKTGASWMHPAEHTWVINPEREEDIVRLLDEVPIGDQLLKVIYSCEKAAAFPDTSVTATDALVTMLTVPVLHLVKALAARTDWPHKKIWLLSRGTADVLPGDTMSSLLPGILWGLGKSIALEYPLLWGGMVDMGMAADDRYVSQLLADVIDSCGENQLAYRDNLRYVARLREYPLAMNTPQRIAADRSYLITGGTGHLGLLVAGWLVKAGAKRLLLLGRKGAGEEALSAIRKLEATGATVTVLQADVAIAADMEKVFAVITASFPPLAGVVHAAGVTGYCSFATLRQEDMVRFSRPKVQGSWLLHLLTRNCALDFFICFSSIASVWGSKGQAHYAAGNYFMDMLCHYRRKQGLPALSVNWGLWEDTKGVTAAEVKMLAAAGINAMSPSVAFPALEAALAGERAQLVIADIDREILSALFSASGSGKMFDELVMMKREEIKEPYVPSLIPVLKAALPVKRKDMLVRALQEEVARVLKWDGVHPPDADTGFFDMGLDSILAIELKKRIEKMLDCTLPATIGFEFPSIQSLADHLLENVVLQEFRQTSTTVAAALPEPELPGTDLSVEALRALLEKELSKG